MKREGKIEGGEGKIGGRNRDRGGFKKGEKEI